MSSSLQVDLLVIGSGAAGMTTAARAARAGARVRVVEKAPQTGGSAAISGGFVWTAAEVDVLLAEDPHADESLVSALVEGFPEGIDWLRSLGIALSGEINGIYGFGRRRRRLSPWLRGRACTGARLRDAGRRDRDAGRLVLKPPLPHATRPRFRLAFAPSGGPRRRGLG